MNHPFLNARKFLPFAHRGENYLKPENTFEAFKTAVDLGYSHIETDVRASKDGIVFIFHDPTLERLTGERIPFHKLTSNDLGKIRLKGGAIIPKLDETLEEFHQIYFNIDAKTWDVVSPLASTINQLKIFHRICVASFNDNRVLKLRKLIEGPICFSAGAIKSIKILMMAHLGVTPKIVEPCIQLPLFFKGIKIINKAVVSKIKKSGTKLHIWGTNKEHFINELIDLGVDGLMVDDCILLKEILIRKGLWD